MCGIAGIHRRTDDKLDVTGRLADGLLLAISHRGSDATGLATINDRGRVHVDKRTVKAHEFLLVRDTFSSDVRTVLLHTRFATRGSATDPNNAHPVSAGKCVAIHNGTIYNDDELFATHKMTRTAEVDSIVIPALVSRMGWANADNALSKLRGGAATAVIHRDHPTEVVLGRTQTYPLHLYVTDDVVVWASEKQAIKLAWRYAYRQQPTGGRWINVPERTIIRVNGKVEMGKLAPLPLSPWHPKNRPTTSKGKRKRSRMPKPRPQQLKMADDAVQRANEAMHAADRVLLEEDVLDLMRQTGASYDEAHEAIFGYSPPDDFAYADPWDGVA